MVTKNNNITVLMSTYNGEKFLREQINSIMAQKGVNLNLVVRDDGSKDKTLSILEEYKSKGQLTYYTGSNIGPQYSFMDLLVNSEQNDYYAFSDQDDFWLEDKLYSAISYLKEHNDKPALYICQTQLTDANLNLRDNIEVHPKLTFGESLIYSYASGCTFVFNKKLKDFIAAHKIPDKLPMHDIWIILSNMAIDGYTYFDTNAHILYRQHENNEIGLGHGFFFKWHERLIKFCSKNNIRYYQALKLLQTYGSDISKKTY